MRYVRRGIHHERLSCNFLRFEGERDGREHRGNRGHTPLCRIATCKNVGSLFNRVLKGGYGSLRICKWKQKELEKKQTVGFTWHTATNGGLSAYFSRRVEPTRRAKGLEASPQSIAIGIPFVDRVIHSESSREFCVGAYRARSCGFSRFFQYLTKPLGHNLLPDLKPSSRARLSLPSGCAMGQCWARHLVAP